MAKYSQTENKTVQARKRWKNRRTIKKSKKR